MQTGKRKIEYLLSFLSSKSSALCLLVILVVAISIRLLGIRYGLPYTFHTDEPTIVDRALRILRTGDYNPHFFNYSSLMIYFQSVVYAIFLFYKFLQVQRTYFALRKCRIIFSISLAVCLLLLQE